MVLHGSRGLDRPEQCSAYTTTFLLCSFWREKGVRSIPSMCHRVSTCLPCQRHGSIFLSQLQQHLGSANLLHPVSTLSMSSSTHETRPWVERYRPKNLKEVSHQSEVVATLQNAVATGRLPHLLLYGPPGSGKVGRII
jgi:hypothetical protein